MCCLEEFINNIHTVITGRKLQEDNNIVRKHSRKLEELGDLSFPLKCENWYHLLKTSENTTKNVISGRVIDKETDLIEKSKHWHMKIVSCKIVEHDIRVFFDRPHVYTCMVPQVLNQGSRYGHSELFEETIQILLKKSIETSKLSEIDLTSLRMSILKDVSENLIKFSSKENDENARKVYITTVNKKENDNTVNILCGPILNENNLKSSETAENLYAKRTLSMQLMAEHKYGMRVEHSSKWIQFFENLGKAAVIIEMLSNKPHKPCKIVLHDLRISNKGAFIMYNCARLTTLFREFDKKVGQNKYPPLPEIDKIDFSLLTQPEEWELMYVYILQFPLIIKSCIKDITKGILNPHNLILFLYNLASTFSIYYRRVRLLTDPREHMFSIIHTRMYLLKALQHVYYNALVLLNIEPIKEM